jgi:hypothetical protein
MRRSLLSRVPVLACLATLAVCGPAGSNGTGPTLAVSGDPSTVVFLAQDTPPVAYMEALFIGRVTRDAQGCLRLDTDDRHTVIWPRGYTLEANGAALVVKDDQGHAVGTVEGSFRVPGGEVPSLDFVDNLAEQTRAQAANCPGRYWVAAPDR